MVWSMDSTNTEEWDPDYFECEPAPDDSHNDWLHVDNGFPKWTNPHIEQLQHFWSLCRVYCKANSLPLLDDSVTFAAFCRSLSGMHPSAQRSRALRHTVTAPVRWMLSDPSVSRST